MFVKVVKFFQAVSSYLFFLPFFAASLDSKGESADGDESSAFFRLARNSDQTKSN